jgi:hypothetical protein
MMTRRAVGRFAGGAAALVLFVLGGCVATVGQRLPADVAAALVDRPMRRLETQTLILYYPAGRKDQALRFAGRVEGCAQSLRSRAHIKQGPANDKMVVLLPEVPFNNAFVAPGAVGYDAVSVVPTWNSFDFTAEMGLPPDPAHIGCHEITHYVQFQQMSGLWRLLSAVFGSVLTPQVGLDAWFSEGLATYYETRFQPGAGRLAWPVWRGMFHAGVAGRDLDGGDLSAFNRDFHLGRHYLMGSHFVAFLVERYGEDWLWRLIAEQGDAWIFFLGANWRFYSVYQRSLSTLIDEWAADTKRRFPVRPRPAGQRRLAVAGQDARYARAATGRQALIRVDPDRSTTLEIQAADGRRERSRRLVDLIPPRRLTIASPLFVSGLSFTADGRELWFVALDRGLTEMKARLIRYQVENDALTVIADDLGGTGGGISGDGTSYWFTKADGDRHELAVFEVRAGRAEVRGRVEPGQYLSLPRPSPDGRRVVAGFFDGHGFSVRVLNDRGQRELDIPVPGGPAYDASWIDDGHLLFLATVDGRFQVARLDLASRTTQVLTDAPYLTFQPNLIGDSLRFLNRDGWQWTVDEVIVAPPPPAPLADPAPSPADGPKPELGGGPTPAPGQDPAAPAPGGPAPAPPPSLRPGATAVWIEPQVVSDEAYSPFDHLFVPQLHAFLLAALGEDWAILGVSLSGADRLERQRWAATVLYQTDDGRFGGSVGYHNAQLAPWFVTATGSLIDQRIQQVVDGPRLRRRERRADLVLGRSFSTFDLTVGGTYVDDFNEEMVDGPRPLRRLGGPTLRLAWSTGEATAVGGTERGGAVGLETTWYPEAASTLDHELVDLGGDLIVAAPLPGTRRHRLSLALRARALAGAPEGSGLLEVGGVGGPFASLWSSEDERIIGDGRGLGAVPSQVTFAEPVRGFEDLSFRVGRTGIATFTWRYPLVIDRGWATFLYLLPSLFVRELDLDAFASGASDGQDHHAAVGAAVSLSTVMWLVPIAVRYQIARRLSDDDALVQTVGLGLGF